MTKLKLIENEVFALRENEKFAVQEQQPDGGRWFAAQARSVTFPAGPAHPVRCSDQSPVENAAIIACQQRDGYWQWMQLSPPTKESIGDLLFDANAEKDKWYFITVTAD